MKLFAEFFEKITRKEQHCYYWTHANYECYDEILEKSDEEVEFDFFNSGVIEGKNSEEEVGRILLQMKLLV